MNAVYIEQDEDERLFNKNLMRFSPSEGLWPPWKMRRLRVRPPYKIWSNLITKSLIEEYRKMMLQPQCYKKRIKYYPLLIPRLFQECVNGVDIKITNERRNMMFRIIKLLLFIKDHQELNHPLIIDCFRFCIYGKKWSSESFKAKNDLVYDLVHMVYFYLLKKYLVKTTMIDLNLSNDYQYVYDDLKECVEKSWNCININPKVLKLLLLIIKIQTLNAICCGNTKCQKIYILHKYDLHLSCLDLFKFTEKWSELNILSAKFISKQWKMKQIKNKWKLCKQCQTTKYCSRKCQKIAWKEHREECVQLNEWMLDHYQGCSL